MIEHVITKYGTVIIHIETTRVINEITMSISEILIIMIKSLE